MMKATIGRIVIYRSRTGAYDVPAVVTCTPETLNPAGVELYEQSDGSKGVPPLSADAHVHLTVFTPGLEGQRGNAEDFESPPTTGKIAESGGTYQEWDVPYWPEQDAAPAAGTWRWPERV